MRSHKQSNFLLFFLIGFIGHNDFLHNRMSYHIASGKKSKTNTLDLFQYLQNMLQPGHLGRWQINLGNVSGNHSRRTKADTRQKHFNLFSRGILCFIQNNKRGGLREE